MRDGLRTSFVRDDPPIELNHPHRVMDEPLPETMIENGPMFFLLALLLFIVLPSPWNFVGGLACLALGALEVTYWQRRMRRQKLQTGIEQLVGATGEVSERLAPSGYVRVVGELWEARSSSELPPGSRVRVVAVHGLVLEVEPLDEATTSARPA